LIIVPLSTETPADPLGSLDARANFIIRHAHCRVFLAAAPVASHLAPASASTGSSVVNAKVFTLPLHQVGQVNLSALAKSQQRQRIATLRQGAPISRSACAR